jgi:hypothetical protein
MVEEVKKIQAANDEVWNDFTKTQYDLVMEKARPLLEHLGFRRVVTRISKKLEMIVT